MEEQKKKALEIALSQIEKQFGKGAVMRLGDSKIMEVESVSTGALTLDVAIGVGGVPRGRVVEVFGMESSGKTTLCLSIVSQAQKEGGVCAYIDAEHALDPSYAKKVGVDINNLLISQPDTGEQALEIAENLVRSGAIDVIVVDSVAALVSRQEIEGEMGESHIALQARLMSQALRKLTSVISKSKTVVLFINQLRQKIGVMFGPTETTPGGMALKFYSSVRLDMRRIQNITKGDEIIGSRVRVKVVKNKIAPPFKEAEFEILYDTGISYEGTLIDIAINRGIITQKGAYYSYKEKTIGQGRENAREFLKKNKDVVSEIENEIKGKV
ncbi:TPA: recombinase RecA [bacterium]|nr:recombinase RecA [bacterium]